VRPCRLRSVRAEAPPGVHARWEFSRPYSYPRHHLARSETRHYTPRMRSVTNRLGFCGALAAGAAGLAVPAGLKTRLYEGLE